MMFGTLIIMLFPTQILSLFMASEKMRSYGIMAMRIMATGYLFCGLSTMISTYMQAIERVLPSIMIQIFRQMFFFDTYYVDFRKSITNHWYLDCISSY